MIATWLQFAGVIAAQAAVVCVVGWYRGASWHELLQVSLYSFVLAIPFGLGFDIIFGHWLGVFSYTFAAADGTFFFLNALLSYGLMLATVYLLRDLPLLQLVLVVWGVAVWYEVVNYFLPVWQWQLPAGFLLTEGLIIGLAYPALALSMWLSFYLLETLFVGK